MKKNSFKFLYIILIAIISFFIFNDSVSAVVTCEANRRSDYEVSFHIYDTSDTEHDGSYVSFRLDSSTSKISTLSVCGESIIKDGNNISNYDLSTKKSFNCDIDGGTNHTISFGSINLTGKFYKLTNTVTCGISYPSTVNITGLVNASETTTTESVMCSGAGYNFIVRKGQDNQSQCNITIQQDSVDGDVIMKHGGKTTVNPKAGKYICSTPEGDDIEFSLEKNLDKGSLKSTSDCPKLSAVSGTDGSQEDIQNPVVGPSEEPDGPSDSVSTKTELQDPDKVTKKSHITVSNIFQVVTNKLTCTSALSNTLPILKDIFKYIRVAAILIFLVLSSLDYLKAIANSDQSAFKKASQHLVKRLIILIVVLILPSIINLILAIVQLSNGSCGIS